MFIPQSHDQVRKPARLTRVPSNSARAGASATVHDAAPAHHPAPAHNPVWQSLATRPFALQPKLAVSQPGDADEQEADHLAERVVSTNGPHLQRACACGGSCPKCRGGQPEEEGVRAQLMRAAGGAGAVGVQAPPVVHEALSSPGRPLDEATRSLMESRFGHDFGGVRVHTGSRADASARDVAAKAFTVGRDVVFGDGYYNPETDSGKRLLAHELTHVVQQSSGGQVGRRYLARAPVTPQSGSSGVGQASAASAIVPPFGPSFAQLWREFEEHQINHRDAEARALAPTLASMMSGREAFDHGLELAQWAAKQGDWKTARLALEALETAWWVEWVSIKGSLPLNTGTLGTQPQTTLINWAKSEAAAGEHARARPLFGLAFLMTQMVLQEQTARQIASLAAMGDITHDLTMIRLIEYSNVLSLVDMLREVLGFYPNLERQALAAGRDDEAARMAELDRQLRTELRERYTLRGSGEGSAAITMQASSATNSRGQEGYTLHGVRGDNEIVTPLPGTPRPDELGKHPAYTASMETVSDTLAGQEDFFTGLMRHPEFRAAFGSKRPDLYDRTQRLRVWQVMFRVFKQKPLPGCPTALCSLLRLMQDYLQHFTTHTEYNIRDFGQSYLATDFPVDLIGRTMQDCGVYAVTVAHEVFSTARSASPRLPVGFQLYHTLEHSMLAIFDTESHTHYVVNNDRITGPFAGDTDDVVVGSIAGAYGGIMGSEITASIGGRSERLTTDLSDAAFRSRVWQNYQVGATLALRTEPPTGPDDTRTEAQRREDTYTRYYQRMRRISEAGMRAHAQLDELNRALPARPAAEHAGIIEPRLASLSEAGTLLALFFDTYLLNPQASGLALDRTTVNIQALGLFGPGPGQMRHPLVRIARLLLYYQKQGGTLSSAQQGLVNGLMTQRVIPSFSNDLAGYVSAGRPASF